MTWRTAKAQIVTLVKATTATYLPRLFGTKYTHGADLDGYGTPPGDGRKFYIECTDAETDAGDYIGGYERTKADAELSVWVPYVNSQPSKFDDGIWTIYEELRHRLLIADNWNAPTSTIVCISGPGDGANIYGERDDVTGDSGEPLGAWLRLQLSVTHEEQGT